LQDCGLLALQNVIEFWRERLIVLNLLKILAHNPSSF